MIASFSGDTSLGTGEVGTMDERQADTEVARAAEADRRLRSALKRHISRSTSINKAAEQLDVVSGTLRHFLSGRTDTGLRRSLRCQARYRLRRRLSSEEVV